MMIPEIATTREVAELLGVKLPATALKILRTAGIEPLGKRGNSYIWKAAVVGSFAAIRKNPDYLSGHLRWLYWEVSSTSEAVTMSFPL